jgi:glycogen debranching enzyme
MATTGAAGGDGIHESHVGAVTDIAHTTVVKSGNTFFLSQADGRLPLGSRHAIGLFHDDTRYLSAHELRLNGARPILLAASDAPGTTSVHDLTNPELKLTDGEVLPMQRLQMRVVRTVRERAVEERIAVRCFTRRPLALTLELCLAADFEAMLALRGIIRELEPPHVDTIVTRGGVTFAAEGRDGLRRSTAIQSTPPPDRIDGACLRYVLELRPRERAEVAIRYEIIDAARLISDPAAAGSEDDAGPPSFPAVLGARGQAVQDVRVHSSSELFNRVVRRSLMDLKLLRSSVRGHPFYAAGIPWYATLFGRDSIITALQMSALDPEIMVGTLRLLARLVGRRRDDDHDEDPGKLIHELRLGELANVAATPLTRYYGTVDAGPLFLWLVAEHAAWTGSLDLFRELTPEIDAVLVWMDRHGDLDGDGLVEYLRRAPGGLDNQGWKDSWDGVPDADGLPLEPPIALVEVQGYVVTAKRRLAVLYDRNGQPQRAGALRSAALQMADRVERFWLEEERCFALALDGTKRASRVVASNQGHLLWAEALDTERAAAVRDALFGPHMWSGWGIRTLADGSVSYNPVGYHTGSVWPHDNALIACGLRAYGFDAEFLRLYDAILDAAAAFAGYRLPELFAGFSRDEYETPVPYPVACRPQAWAAGTVPMLVCQALGLEPNGLDRQLRVRRPLLPRSVDWLQLTGLSVADANVDLRFERVGEHAALVDARIDGDLEVMSELGRRH